MSEVMPRLRSLSKSESREEINESSPRDYTGYKPLSAQDYPYKEDLPQDQDGASKNVDPSMLQDKGKTSKSLILSIILLGISFVTIFVWQILIAQCRVDLLCDTNDRSTSDANNYVFKTLTFRVPSALLWLGLTAGSFALMVSACLSFILLRKSVGPAKVAEIASIMRQGTSALLTQQYIVVLFPVFLIFILLGVAINWETGGCFVFGALISSLACQAGVSVVTRGNIRTTAAAQTGSSDAFVVAFRTCSIVSTAVFAISVVGPSAIYLIFSDITALTALIAGSSAVALFVRTSAAIFNRSARDTIGILHEGIEKDRGSPGFCNLNVAAGIGSGIGRVAALGSDLFTSLSAAVVATAVLGSSLPFFYRSQLALCVFNHLAIDQTCGPFGYPEKLSYATYICRNDNLFLEYPVLKTWGSNSAFIAAPFVLAVIGLLTSIPCVIYVKKGAESLPKISSFDELRDSVNKLRRSLLLNVIVGYVLIISGAAALCFGLFGPNSEFQQSNGFGNGGLLTQMVLDGSSEQCVSKFLDTEDSAQLSPFPVPQGGLLELSHYQPTTVFGISLGEANTTPYRLFGCILIGLALSMLMITSCTKLFALQSKGLTLLLFNSVGLSPGLGIVQGIATGLLYTAVPTVLILAGILGSYNLYGAYGTGMAALGFITPLSFALFSTTLGYVSENANHLAWESNLSRTTKQNTGILSIAGTLQIPPGLEYSNGASFLSAGICLLALIQQTGILPSPSDLIGSSENPPTRLIGDVFVVSLSDTYILISMFIGTFIPILVAGLIMIGANSATNAVYLETRQQRSTSQERPNYTSFFSKTARTALLEASIPVIIAIAAPLAIAFGLGAQAVVAFLIALVSTGYILGTFFTSTTSNWTSLSQLMSARLILDPPNEGRDGRISSEVVDFWDTVGPSLQTLTKVCTSVSLACATLMHRDRTRGWIAGVIIGISLLFIALIVIMKQLRQKRLMRGVKEPRKQVNAPPKRVSPFYEDGHRIDPHRVRVGSQMYEALEALGSPKIPIGVNEIGGLSDRDVADLNGKREFMTPRGAMRVEEKVFKDESGRRE